MKKWMKYKKFINQEILRKEKEIILEFNNEIIRKFNKRKNFCKDG